MCLIHSNSNSNSVPRASSATEVSIDALWIPTLASSIVIQATNALKTISASPNTALSRMVCAQCPLNQLKRSQHALITPSVTLATTVVLRPQTQVSSLLIRVDRPKNSKVSASLSARSSTHAPATLIVRIIWPVPIGNVRGMARLRTMADRITT